MSSNSRLFLCGNPFCQSQLCEHHHQRDSSSRISLCLGAAFYNSITDSTHVFYVGSKGDYKPRTFHIFTSNSSMEVGILWNIRIDPQFLRRKAGYNLQGDMNIPVAIFCYRHVGKKFVLFSMLQVFFASTLLKVLPENHLFDDILLNICFGGFLYGISMVMALKGNASTGGMDFVALYISNKKGKSIWSYVFVFNATLITIFGCMCHARKAAGQQVNGNHKNLHNGRLHKACK